MYKYDERTGEIEYEDRVTLNDVYVGQVVSVARIAEIAAIPMLEAPNVADDIKIEKADYEVLEINGTVLIVDKRT